MGLWTGVSVGTVVDPVEVAAPVEELLATVPIAGPGFSTLKKFPAMILSARPASVKTVRASKSSLFAEASSRAERSSSVASDVSTKIWVYLWESGTLAGGFGPMYSARADWESDVWNMNAVVVPVVVLMVVAESPCVRPVCIQCNSVPVSGGVSVGISRSIITTANDVPSNLLCVPMTGAV